MDAPDSETSEWLHRLIEHEETADAAGIVSSPPAQRHPLTWFTRTLLAISFAKVAAALTMVVLAAPSPSLAGSWIPVGFVILLLASFTGAGSILLLAHARDPRTANLGFLLIVTATAFATSHARDLAQLWPAVAVLGPLYPDAFLALALGRFIQDFPARHPHSRSTTFLRALVRASAVAGATLFLANAFWGWGGARLIPWLSALQRRSAGGTIYWAVVFGLVFLMLPFAFVGDRTLPPTERRRIRLFWSAFAAGFGPTVLIVVLGTIPVIGPRVTAWAKTLNAQVVSQSLLASVPLTVAYAVLVRQLLPLRVVLRRAAQYLLARWTITAAFLMPLLAVAAEAYIHRNETIAAVFSGRAKWLLLAGAVAGLALFAREELRRTLDRWFFREAYDARRVLVDLGEQIRRAQRIDELVAMLTAGIDRALQPEAVAVLVRDPTGQQFVSLFGSVEPLGTSSVLASLLGAAAEPVDVRLGEPESPLRWLPRQDRQWLVDSRSRLIVPLRSSEQALVGIVTLADRKSELPFLAEDRWLLMAIADAGALMIENHAIRTGSPDSNTDGSWQVGILPSYARARECPACGHVQPADRVACSTCSAVVVSSDVPEVLFGKFRFEQRVGRGAMGVVYRAHDLTLDRTVAIKTLPGTSPELAERLRFEAKSMAAVMHRHLAIIYGAESWRGRPMLICEFMTHGTLDDRLSSGPLAIPEAIDLGVALAEALAVIHAAGLLHRDLKPSNIGYAHDRVPKILDFGLVHLLSQTQRVEDTRGPDRLKASSRGSDLLSLSLTGPLVGTPLYLSPEATHGHRPTVAFDLWSLNVLLLEAITGHHPFRGGTVEDTLDRIRKGPVAATFAQLRHSSSALASYFERALAKDAASRPSNAAEVADALRRVARSS